MDLPPEIPPSLELPNYLPTTTENLREINNLLSFKDDLTAKLDEQIKSIKSDVNRFIEFIVTENLFNDLSELKQIFDNHGKAVYELLRSKQEADMWRSAFQASRARIHNNMHGEDVLSLQNISHYRESQELTFAQGIDKEFENSKTIEQQRNDLQAYVTSNESYKFINNISFILTHPEDPLPDEVEDEEISVAGGKISLKDPISLNYFEHPMKSRRCNHVYEKQHVLQALLDNTIGHQCPVSGCSSRMNANDLIPDELMTLRVKVYLATMSNNISHNDNIDRL